MKLIAIETTWFFIIIIAAIVISISILIALRERIQNYLYCNVYLKIFPKETIPEYCKSQNLITERIKFYANNEEEAISKFASYLFECIQTIQRYKVYDRDYTCYEIDFSPMQENIKIFPENVSMFIKQYDGCKSLQMKTFDCGYRDDVVWKVKDYEISKDSIVIIKYNHNIDAIEVIA
ncbi:MAG: hypothetical protein QXP34_00360 [Candidatus Aenigmatarchaeota archaeon]